MIHNATLTHTPTGKISFYDSQSLLNDYKLCCISREISTLIRKEVLSGKAKFGIGSAGKELHQVLLAKFFQKGDFYSGYYRDQTFMLAKGLSEPKDIFAALYADTQHDIFSGGRQMNNHFATPMVDSQGDWMNQTQHFNVSSAISPLAGHVPRALGLAIASKRFRDNPPQKAMDSFSLDGESVSFCVVGDASTSEGIFFETVNAAGVLQVPIAFIVQDDGYGISVPKSYQTTKGSISEVLKGFQSESHAPGLAIYRVKAWDVESLWTTFEAGIAKIRDTHTPAIFHIEECTQPNGHSTSGSHERYKSSKRLQWEQEWDCIAAFKRWILNTAIADEATLTNLEFEAKQEAKIHRNNAWKQYSQPIHNEQEALLQVCQSLKSQYPDKGLDLFIESIQNLHQPVRSDLLKIADKIRIAFTGEQDQLPEFQSWYDQNHSFLEAAYDSHLHVEGPRSALHIEEVAPLYTDQSPMVNGFEVLNHNFDRLLHQYPELCAFGEDVGKIGDVNQGFAGLQEKYGEARVFDTGIREWSIAGQAIGMAMRGLRPIAEIQYLDYIHYALAPLADDLATLHYRTRGMQKAPVIIRTRGHRLEGIWHAGSPIAMLLHSLRGIYLCVPRDMTRAAGMYNTLLQSDDPALVIECLNGYRQKEPLPENLGEFTLPLGVPEVLRTGEDLTLVTYGSCVRIAQEACELLSEKGISVELIDVQTLLPFDRQHRVVQSLKKTNRILFLDEDVPGGATAYMMQQVLETQGGYYYLDSPAQTLTAKASRPPYGSDGDYFHKPQVSDVFFAVLDMVKEAEPNRC